MIDKECINHFVSYIQKVMQKNAPKLVCKYAHTAYFLWMSLKSCNMSRTSKIHLSMVRTNWHVKGCFEAAS